MKKRNITKNIWSAGHYVAVCFAVFAVVCLARMSPLGETLERRWFRAIELHLRTAIRRANPVDNRIKVFTDNSNTELKGELVSAILDRKPRLLLIDHELITPQSGLGSGLDPALRGNFAATGYFAHAAGMDLKDRIVPREKLQNADQLGQYKPYKGEAEEIFYSLAPSELTPFARVAYLDFGEHGYFPAVRQTQGGGLAVHASLLAAEHLVFYANAIDMDGGMMYVTADGHVPLDMPERNSLRSSIRSLGDLATTGPTDIRAGDVVAFIKDRELTRLDLPLPMTRAEAFVSAANSVITRKHPRESQAPWFIILASCILASLAALSIDGIRGVIAAVGVGIGWVIFGLLTASIKAVYLPWGFAFLASLITGSIMAVMTSGERRRIRDAIATHIQGRVSPRTASLLTKDLKTLMPEASPCLVSFLAIDAEVLPIEEESLDYGTLATRINSLKEGVKSILLAHGAVLTIETDGSWIAFFGATIDGRQSDDDHARSALKCAIEIQKLLMTATLEGKDMAAFALIGLETAMAKIGVLDSNHPFDFGAKSDAIALLHQMRSGCGRYRVLVGPRARHILPKDMIEHQSAHTKWVKLPQTPDLVGALEIEPLAQEGTKLSQAEARCERAIKYVRQDTRWAVPEGNPIFVMSSIGRGQLINYSSSGIMLRWERLLAPGADVTIDFDTEDQHLSESLKQKGFAALPADVRWARPDAQGGFLHGLRFAEEFNPGQRELLVGLLAEYCNRVKRQGA